MVFIPRPSKSKKSKSKVSKASKSKITDIVKSVVNRNIQSKMQTYYSNAAGFAGDGTVANATFAAQDQFITNNVTDILRLIPFVSEGTKDNQRIGESIKPFKLEVQGTIQIDFTNKLLLELPCDLYAVVYVLEHAFIKQYTTLALQNDFNYLLSTGQNSNQRFNGDYISSTMPVSKQYYKLIKKKVIPLRYAGSQGTTTTSAYSVANAHQYRSNFSFTLKDKHLPANLKYPENTGTTIAGQNDPNNCSLFMCVGYYLMNSQVSPITSNAYIQQQYVTALHYKDA